MCIRDRHDQVKLRFARFDSVPEIAIQEGNALLNHVVDNEKVHAKNKYRDDHNGGCGLHFFPRRRRNFAGLGADVVVERLHPLRPGLDLVSETPCLLYTSRCV